MEEKQHTYPPVSPPSPNHTPDLSLGALFSDLSSDLSILMRQEIELARTETTETIRKTAGSAGLLVAGGLVAYAGLIILLIAVAILLGAIMPYWASSLLVGVVVLIIGAVMAMSGKNQLANLTIVPEKTVATLKEDARWAKEQLS